MLNKHGGLAPCLALSGNCALCQSLIAAPACRYYCFLLFTDKSAEASKHSFFEMTRDSRVRGRHQRCSTFCPSQLLALSLSPEHRRVARESWGIPMWPESLALVDEASDPAILFHLGARMQLPPTSGLILTPFTAPLPLKKG